MKFLRFIASLAVCLTLGGGIAATTQAADYPSQPIKLLVPFGAGGSADVSARIFAKYLEKELGQKIAIVNMTGAAGSIATTEAAKSNPDGYTLLWHIPTIFTAYDTGAQPFTWDSLTPISNVARFFKVMVVDKDAPWKTLQELIDDAKANPGKIKYGLNPGAGLHFEVLGMEDATGAKFSHVAGGGDTQQVTSLLGKHIDVTTPSDTVVLQYIADGTLRPLGTSGLERLPTLPNVPTYKEQGIDAPFWYDLVLYGPPNMDPKIVEQISAAGAKVMQNPEAVKELEKIGMYPGFLNVADTRKALLDKDVEMYRFAVSGELIPDDLKEKLAGVSQKVLADPKAVEEFQKAGVKTDEASVKDDPKARLDRDVAIYRFARSNGLIPDKVE